MAVSFIKLLIILVHFIFHQCVLTTETIEFVYEDQNIKSLNMEDAQFFKIKACLDFNYIFASAGINGVFIISSRGQTMQVVHQITSKDTFVKGFDITQDCKYLVMNHENHLTIFQFISSNQEIRKLISTQDNLPPNIVDLKFNGDNSLVYVVGSSGKLQVFSFSSIEGQLKEIQLSFSPQSQSYLSALNTNFFPFYKNMIFITTTFQGIRIAYEELINKPPEISIQLSDIGYFTDMQNSMLFTNNGEYIIALNQWNGISFGSLEPLKQWKLNDLPQTFSFFLSKWWPSNTLNPSPLDGVLSDDNKLLFVAARSQGLYIIDISNIFQPKPFQHIQSDGTSILILFSPLNKYLYFSNSQTIDVFTQEQVYLSDQFPNLFNTHLGTEELSNLVDSKYKWRCYINKNNEYYFGSYDEAGLVFAKLLQQGTSILKQIDISPYFTKNYFFIDSLLFSDDEKYVYVPLVNSQDVLGIFDISDIEKPQLISTVKSNIFSRLEQMSFNSDKSIIAATVGQSLIMMDISDKSNPTLVNQLFLNKIINTQCSGVMFANQDKYLVISSRGQGFLVLSYNGPQDIQVLNFLSTLGGEDVKPFIGNTHYAYLVDGYNGILIINLDKLPELDIISKIQLPGWSNNILSFENDKYVIISTMDRGMISLFDMSEIKKPVFVSSYQKPSQNAYSTCKTSTNSQLFINNQSGVQTLPLKSEFSIHTQFSEVITNEQQEIVYRKNEKQNILEVGQQIRLSLRFIYPKRGVIIKGTYFYNNEQILDLPHWISYSSTSYTININVSKDGLMENQTDENLNTILVKSQIPIDSKMFIFTNEQVKIEEDLSKKIFLSLQDMDLIDSQNYLNEDILQHGIMEMLSPDYFDGYNLTIEQHKQTVQYIQQTIFRTIQFNPIYFYVQSSLFLDLDYKKGQVIRTNSQYASIQITVEEKYGSFYIIDDSGVLITYQDGKSTIMLSGDVKLVNQILNSEKVIFINSKSFNNTSQFGNISLNIEVKDNINYNIVHNCTLFEAKFISLKKQIEVQQPLQDLFEQAYSEGQIKVDTYLYVQFATSNFVDPQNFPLHFTAKYKTDSTPEEEVVGSGWLQFSYNQESLRIQGLVPQSLFWSYVYITIIASNGYQEIEQTFSMNINIISFSLFINIFLQVGGPLAGIIGFYKYRNIPYNIFYKQRLFSTPEIIQVDQEYIKKFPLLSSEYRRAKKIFTQYKRYVIKDLEKQCKEQKDSKGENRNNLLTSQKQIYKTDQTQQIINLPQNNFCNTQNSILPRKKSIDEQMIFMRVKKQSIFSPYHQNQSKDDEIIEPDLVKKIQDPNDLNQSKKLDTSFQAIPDQKQSIPKFTMVKSVRLISEKADSIDLETKSPTKLQSDLNNERKISSGKREKTLSSDSSDDGDSDIDQVIDDCQERRKNSRIGKLTASQAISSRKNDYNQRIINLIKKYQDREISGKSQYRTDFQDYITRKFVRKNGKLRMHMIVDDILQSTIKITYKRKYVPVQNYRDDLENEFSVLRVSLKSFFTRFLLQKNKPANIVYKYIKKTCQSHNAYTERDWYKAIVDIKANKDTDKNGINIPFPNLFIREEEFRKYMSNLQIIRYKNNTYDLENNIKINLYLIKEVLFADTLGLHTANIDSIQPTFGESIHFNSSQISSVEALIPIRHSSWLRIRQFLNLDNREYGCSQNNKLPNWVNFNQKSNVIILQGIPLKHDVEDILIRVYDVDKFILVQYYLKITNNNVHADLNLSQSLTTSCFQQPQNQLASTLLNRRQSVTSSFNKKGSPIKTYDYSPQRVIQTRSNDVIQENIDDEINEYQHQTTHINQNDSLAQVSLDESHKLEQKRISIPQFSHLLGSQLGMKSSIKTQNEQQQQQVDKSF